MHMFLKQERFKISLLRVHLRKLGNTEQIKCKVSRRKRIIKIRAEVNEIESKKSIEKNNKNKLIL